MKFAKSLFTAAALVATSYTGAIAGRYPKSWIKITLAALAVLATIATFVVLTHR